MSSARGHRPSTCCFVPEDLKRHGRDLLSQFRARRKCFAELRTILVATVTSWDVDKHTRNKSNKNLVRACKSEQHFTNSTLFRATLRKSRAVGFRMRTQVLPKVRDGVSDQCDTVRTKRRKETGTNAPFECTNDTANIHKPP